MILYLAKVTFPNQNEDGSPKATIGVRHVSVPHFCYTFATTIRHRHHHRHRSHHHHHAHRRHHHHHHHRPKVQALARVIWMVRKNWHQVTFSWFTLAWWLLLLTLTGVSIWYAKGAQVSEQVMDLDLTNFQVISNLKPSQTELSLLVC